MATLTNCLQIVNAMPQQDQDALLARLDELQAQGLSPKEAQLQAAIDVLAQVEQAADPESGADAADIRWSPRRGPAPKKTVTAYKLFRVDAKQPGKLFPLFVNANEPINIGEWLDADEGPMQDGKVKSKLGPLAYRPGWHAGDLPIATHIGGKSDASLKKPDTRPDNQVWAEIEMAADKDWQTEANKRGTNADGKLVSVRAHITDQVPENGFYRYKTNPNMTGNWLIGGSMRVNRILSDEEVESINAAAGTADLVREKPFNAKKYGFDVPSSGILKSVDRPQFYSQLQRAIEQVPDRLDNMGAVAWKQWLTANAPKLGVKAEEVEWSGIKDYLDLQGKKKLSKDELSSYLDDSGVKVSEVMLTQSPNEGVFIPEDSDEEYAPEPDRPTKYGVYTLPGGENYRELLITLPFREPEMPKGYEVTEMDYGKGDMRYFANTPTTRSSAYKTRAEADAELKRMAEGLKDWRAKQQGYKSSHWDDLNVLAHIRTNDRKDADGKRVLFVEEVQSDWGQDGKKKGFQPSDAQIKANAERSLEIRKRVMDLRKQGFQAPDDETPLSEIDPKFLEVQALLQEEEGIRKQDSFYRGLPPSAPFVTKTEGWLNLALKRIAMMAVEGGYDKVAFVNGEQSADRYDLSKQLSRVAYREGRLQGYSVDGALVMSKSIEPSELPDFVGKELGAKMAENAKKDAEVRKALRQAIKDDLPEERIDALRDQLNAIPDEYSGLDLKVGGEGMKTFYNQIVPQAVSKLLPKIGGEKLGEVNLPISEGRDTDPVSGEDVMLDLGIPERDHRDYWSGLTQSQRDKLIDDYRNRDVTPSPQPGFDVTDKMRETVGQGLPLFSKDREGSTARKPWFEDLSKLKVSTNYQLGDLLKSSKKLSWWDRTVGTQYNLATKQPEFKRVFDAVQNFINDVSAYATRAADMAPTILPRLESFKDIVKQPMTPEDVAALRDPVFGGTLKYMRDEDGNIVETDDVQKAGVVFSDAELKSMFKLSDDQIGLYRQFRSSVDQSVTDLALSDMVRYLGEDGRDIAETVMASGNVDVAVGIINSHLGDLAREKPTRTDLLDSTRTAIELKGEQANRLMDRGYAPLSRFGQFTTYVVGKDGEQLYFGMFENERDAQKMAREMREQYPDATVSTSTMSQESYKLFSGVTPETLALFGESLGLDESGIDTKSEVFQQYLKVAKTNRSAMKRLIERKGIDGFSEDAGRVLAGFVYSNARQISTNLHAGEIGKAAADVKDGDVKDAAIRLMEYIQNPQEEAQAIRGLLFTQFIGGSIASALVNMTQPFTMTAPYLAQFDGVTGATKRMAEAMKLVSRGVRNDADLQDALKRAEDEGIVSPQEVHQLMAQARGKGSLITGDGTKVGDAAAKANNFTAKLGLAWGKAFSAAEQFNRRITFIAAYKLARDKGMENPFAFAEQTIAETQGIYNKGNKPAWARGAVGGTLFTFKQYSISYVEFLRRMWGNGPEGKKAVGLALGVLFMSAGLGGLPGADDLDDVIDGFAQRVLGKSFDSKQAKKEFFASILGQSGAEFVMGGLTGLPGAPIDLSGRLGLGNLIPGTGIFTKKSDYGRDTAEIFGPAGSLFKQVAVGAGKLVQGDVTGAAKEVAPVAAQNVIKAVDMAVMGMYRDTRGRKVIDVEPWEAVAKAVGFQPASVKRVQDATGTQQNLIGQNKLRETEIADKWAAGRIEKNPAKVEEAKEMLADWNRKNPQSPISIDQSQINRRVQQAMMEKAKRLEKTAPKEIRQAVKRELERESN